MLPSMIRNSHCRAGDSPVRRPSGWFPTTIGFSLVASSVLLSGCSGDEPTKPEGSAPPSLSAPAPGKDGKYDLSQYSEDVRSIGQGLETLITVSGQVRRTLPADKSEAIEALRVSTEQGRLLKIAHVFTELATYWIDDMSKDQVNQLRAATSDTAALIEEVRTHCRSFDSQAVQRLTGLLDVIEEVNQKVIRVLPQT